jgi:hypothetical protein
MRPAGRRAQAEEHALGLPCRVGPRFCNLPGIEEGTGMSEERIVYGCVVGDRPEALPFIDEVNGSLYYTCPKCREEFAALLD